MYNRHCKVENNQYNTYLPSDDVKITSTTKRISKAILYNGDAPFIVIS